MLDFKFIENGLPLWLSTYGKFDKNNNPIQPSNLSTKVSNLLLNENDIYAFVDKITEECRAGQIEPINYNPKYICMIFGVPKKDEFGFYTKTRVIRNGSFKTLNTTAINDWIRQEKCAMPTLPNLKTYVKLFLTKSHFAIYDLADFFRQIGLDEADADFIGYSLFGLRFRDRKQPYGVSSAPANCQYFAQLLIWIIDNVKLREVRPDLAKAILVHIDDFCLTAESKSDCEFLETIFNDLLTELNVKISHHKTIHTCSEAVLYGIKWNLITKTLSIPDKSLIKLSKFIKLVIKYRCISARAFESLAGKIMHWAQVNSCTKPLVFNSLWIIYKNIRNGLIKKTQVLILPLFIIADLHYFLKFISCLIDVPMNFIINNPSINIYAATDASSTAGGYVVHDKFSSYNFSKQHISEWNINYKEAHVVLSMIKTNCHLLSGKSVLVYIDNTSCFYSMIRKWSKSFDMMAFIYELALLLMKYRIYMKFEWLPSAFNFFADSLSRDDLPRFLTLCSDFNLNLQFQNTLYFNDFNFSKTKLLTFNKVHSEYNFFCDWLSNSPSQKLSNPYNMFVFD